MYYFSFSQDSTFFMHVLVSLTIAVKYTKLYFFFENKKRLIHIYDFYNLVLIYILWFELMQSNMIGSIVNLICYLLICFLHINKGL
jgi:hypothetical protein